MLPSRLDPQTPNIKKNPNSKGSVWWLYVHSHQREHDSYLNIIFICHKWVVWHARAHAHAPLYVLNLTTSPPHSSPVSLIPGGGSSPWCLRLNSRDSGIIQTFHGTYSVPPGRQRQRRKMPPRSLSLYCPHSLISPSLRLPLPPWCVVLAWENAGLSGCYVLRSRPQRSRRVMLEPSVPAVGLTAAAETQCMYLYLLFRQNHMPSRCQGKTSS